MASGFVLLVLVYYLGAEFYLIDLDKMDLHGLAGGGDFRDSLGVGLGRLRPCANPAIREDNLPA